MGPIAAFGYQTAISMRLYLKNFLVASLLLVSSACGAQDDSVRSREQMGLVDSLAKVAPTLYGAHGLVKSITPNRKHMIVAHGDIPGFMTAMTMPFAVADSALLSNVSPDDSIRFVIEVDGSKIGVNSIEVIE